MKKDKKILKESKGITLIALIITIIVLLILVLVTINVALNGKLFENANKGTKDTEREMIGEQIIGAMEINDYGDIDAKKTFDNVQNKLFPGKVPESSIKWNKDNTEVEFDVTGKKGTYRYKITGTGITKIEDVTTNPIQDPTPDADDIIFDGKEVTIDGKDYYILFKEDELGEGQGAQLISKYVYEIGALGKDDSRQYNNVVQITGITDTNILTALTSYNNVVQTLNKECENIINVNSSDILNIRSFGSNPLNPDSDEGYVSGTLWETGIPWNNETYNAGIFNGKVKKGKLIWFITQDEEKLRSINPDLLIGKMYGTEKAKDYFVACHGLWSGGNHNYYLALQKITSTGGKNFDRFVQVSTDVNYDNVTTKYVRPIVTLKYGVLNKYINNN